jgi:hypothetical protein
MLAVAEDAAHSPEADLERCIDEIAAEEIDRLSEAALEEQLIHLRRQIDRLEAECCRRLRRFDRARGFTATGAASVVAWLRNTCGLSASAAHERAEMARGLAELPEAEQAWRRGEITFHHAAVLARSVREAGGDAVRKVLSDLLEAAHRLDPTRLGYVTRYLRYCVDPDGARASEDDAHERRFLDLSQTLDGIFVLNGQFGAEAGAMLRAAINALNQPVPGDTRTASQRRADALAELASRHLKDGRLPSSHGQRPHLVVTVPQSTLDGDGSRPGELAGIGPISSELVQRLACDASIRTATIDGTGSPVLMREASPVIPPSLRAALALRDRGCRFPGCDRPPEWTDAHHIQHRAEGGSDSIENLTLLCRLHHRLVHEGRWRMVRTIDGGLDFQPP